MKIKIKVYKPSLRTKERATKEVVYIIVIQSNLMAIYAVAPSYKTAGVVCRS